MINRRILLLAALAAAPAKADPLAQTLDVSIPGPCSLICIEGVNRLVYELHIVNYTSSAVSLLEVRVLDAASGETLQRYGEDEIARRCSAGALRHAPGQTSLLYVEASTGTARPSMLGHILTFTNDQATTRWTARGPDQPTVAAPTVIGAPLRGEPWIAVHHPDWPRGHRRVPYTIDARMRIPGRFAVDWVRTDARGRIARGERDIAANHLGYGSPVFAGADGRIAAMRDGVQESRTLSGNTHQTLDGEAGNFVSVKMAPRKFLIYEHLKPGSIRVRPGETVRRGQHLAELGFSGSSTGPHLHFHLSDAPMPLSGEGLPFALESFDLLGSYQDPARIDQAVWNPPALSLSRQRTFETPAPCAVIAFGD